MALGAVVGREDILINGNPGVTGDSKGIAVSGTLHGNPLSAAAGLTCLRKLKEINPYDDLYAKGKTLRDAFQEVLDRHRLDIKVIGNQSWWQFFAGSREPTNYADFLTSDMLKTKVLDTALNREVFNTEYRPLFLRSYG